MMEYKRLFRLTLISFILICAGVAFVPLFRINVAYLFVGASLVALGIFGMLMVRRKGLEIKHTKPELYKAEKEKAEKRIEERRKRELNIKDFPRWMIVLLVVAVVLGFMGEMGLFNSNDLLSTIMLPAMILLLIIYYYYEYKIAKKKKERLLETP